MYSDFCYMYVWLEEGVLDFNIIIWYSLSWFLEKVIVKEMWYF